MAQDGLEPEEGFFHPDFKEYAESELNWSRLHTWARRPDDMNPCPIVDDDYLWPGIRWVFWSRQDDDPERPLYHDNFVGSISDACPSPEVIRENIRHALHKMILDPCLTNALVQFWAPTKTSEGRNLLTTESQPFALGNTIHRGVRRGLCEYRMVMCREYNNCFYADAGSGEDQLGVLGRVFLHKFPEFNADVEYCSPKEYPQRDLALRCYIQGYWALPVFELSSQNCVGVLEISMLYPDMPFDGYLKDSLRHVLDRFQEFGLQCFSGCKDSEMRDEDEDKDEDKNKALADAFEELETVSKSVCEIHMLPLAITWVPCSTCDHLFQGQNLFLDEDFFEDDSPLIDYKEVLKTCHLRKGQVTGRILTFPKLSYCSDVKQFSIAEHPLVAHVRRLELSGCFTMCLQSSWTGSELYVLEFFLPPISKDGENILTRLSSILRTVEENSQTFKLACSQEFGGGLSVEVIDFRNGQRSHTIQMIEATRVFPTLDPLEDGGVSISTLKRVCRDYGINRWPPRNMKKVHSPQPLPFENQEQTPRLSPDLPSNQVSAQEQTPRLSSELPSNQVSASVVRIKPACQDEDLVTIRAKYGNLTIKFRLSLSSTLAELHQEVAKRLNMEAGNYYVKYKDEDDVLILIACDNDLQDCARYFRSVGKTPIVVQLEPKQSS